MLKGVTFQLKLAKQLQIILEIQFFSSTFEVNHEKIFKYCFNRLCPNKFFRM